jgi:tripartite-type tricarboxylate transporter receptor subunit TctC
MKFPRRQFLRLAASAAAVPAVSPFAWAQAYPSHQITVIVPFPPGGTTDVLARIMAERMKMSLGRPIIIENVSGANGINGVGRAARAMPDGYTIEMGQWSTHVVPGAIYPLPYDPAGDFEPIAPTGTVPIVLYGKKALPANDLKGLITWLKANPDKASQATTTAGTHAFGALFQKETGTRFQFVPYRGAAPAIQDLVAGQIDLVFDSAVHLPQVRAGNIKAFFVTANTRLSIAPDIPTIEEAGFPALSFSVWFALFAPKGTPKNVTDTLNAAAVDALADPVVRQRLAENGFGFFRPDQQTSQALGALVKADIENGGRSFGRPTSRGNKSHSDEGQLRVIRYTSLRDENRSMSAMPRKRRWTVIASSAAMGRKRSSEPFQSGGKKTEPLMYARRSRKSRAVSRPLISRPVGLQVLALLGSSQAVRNTPGA